MGTCTGDSIHSTEAVTLQCTRRPFIVQADASDIGIGAGPLQWHEDGMHPEVYVSKKLLPRERNYSVIERSDWLRCL